MFLKRVTLAGFKSFCDRVDFDFGPGITCIVGPNGCGKSNVVDGFKWVLGEQSARSLRGRQMADMIFSGSSSRRSSSVAQVDLVFDNSDHSLPIDAQEVTVTRKLYRSGDSEYQINKQVVRLKDVRELFLDTGVGVDAYSVIEQGRVDSLLQHSPVERRIIFEEAAGISRYKARKREASRKLDRAAQNLLRVEDIIEEVEKRLRSVKLQAGKARSYKQYDTRLGELRSSFSLAEYHRFTQDIHSLTKARAECGDQSVALRAEIGRDEAASVAMTARIDQLVEQIGVLDNQLVQTKSELATHEERIAAADDRVEEQRVLRDRTEERMSADRRKLDEAHAELEETKGLSAAVDEQIRQAQVRIDELYEKDRSLAREVTEAQAILEDEKAGIIDLLRQSAQAHNEIVRLNTHRESLIGQKGRLATRDAQIHSELAAQLAQKSQFEARLREVVALIETETTKLEEKKIEAARIDAVRQRLVDELANLKEERSALLSRREVLRDLESKMEGIGAGVRRLLEAKDESVTGGFDCVAGLVADIFEADVAHAHVIEAVLDGWDRHVVVEDREAFLEALATLGEMPGRLTAVCLDRLPPMVNQRDFSDQPGFVSRAVDLVRYDTEFHGLAQHLFGKTIVVESLTAAIAMAGQDHSGHRFVTMNGELVEGDGRISVGPASAGSGLISRKSELRDIDVRLAVLDHRVAGVADQLSRTQADAGHLDAAQQELRNAIYESNTARVEVGAALQRISDDITRLTREQPIIAQEVVMIDQQMKEILDKTEAGSRSLVELDRENEAREKRIAEHQERIDAIVESRHEVQETLTQARIDAGQLTEKRAASVEAGHVLARTIRELEDAQASAQADLDRCAAQIEESRQAGQRSRRQVQVLGERVVELDASTDTHRRERDSSRLELEGCTHAVKAARGRLESVEAELHQHEMSLAQTGVRRDELSARVLEDLGINLAERYEQYEHTEQDWAEVEAEIAELRGKMDRLGNVNLDAIDELAELQERQTFLTTQRDDLNDSRRQLEALIEKLNAESEDRFREAFASIRGHFRELFRKLFGGGRADIILEDPDDILESGIEIVAQPPGKELQSISLMSGGEKSMTAIALLMSIFKNRPAPFAILDEVDASLDEANNDRFNMIIKEFVSESQFVIITHSKTTMNIGDRLYGITMQEPGVSTRVSVKLTDVSAA